MTQGEGSLNYEKREKARKGEEEMVLTGSTGWGGRKVGRVPLAEPGLRTGAEPGINRTGYRGWASRKDGLLNASKMRFEGNREAVRNQVADTAVAGLLTALEPD